MGKQAVVENLRRLADSIEALTEESHTEEIPVKLKKASPTKITFEDLRTVLAVITRQGKQDKVKQLITKYDATKLSDVPEDKYHELLEEARKIE